MKFANKTYRVVFCSHKFVQLRINAYRKSSDFKFPIRRIVMQMRAGGLFLVTLFAIGSRGNNGDSNHG